MHFLGKEILKPGILMTVILFSAFCALSQTKIWLDELDLSKVDQAAGGAVARKSMWNTPLIIAGDTFERGVGNHASGMIRVNLNKGTKTFHAMVGLDDSPPERERNKATAEFIIYADGKEIWKSGVMKAGDKARKVEVSLKGISILQLFTEDAGDGIIGDRTDWADAWFEITGVKPETFQRIAEKEFIQTPSAANSPKINAPYVFAARPGNPVLITLPISGTRPMKIKVASLPSGLSLDNATGQIHGSVKTEGNFEVLVTAENQFGQDSRKVMLKIGEVIAPTPPMGWNSWNAFGSSVSQEKVKEVAEAMVKSGLINYGYTYINIDDGWQGERGGKYNAIMPNEKFPDMKGLVDYIHRLGLKAGIYSSPWVWTYAGFPGGSADTQDGKIARKERRHGEFSFEQEDVKQYAEWGFDYIKYDWSPNDIGSTTRMAKALRNSGRDIVFSISNAAPFELATEWAKLTNVWRTTFDIHDSWYSLTSIGFSQNPWQPYAGPGHWNDPDMLIVGKLGWGNSLHKTRLTPNEQYLHISLWSILAAPLLIGCDMASMDPFTLNLLANREVIEVNQDPAGIQGRRIFSDKNKQIEIWSRPLADGSLAVGLFNLSDMKQEIAVSWKDLDITGKQKVHNLWLQTELGTFESKFSSEVPDHGVVFIKIKSE
jgi:alpha-galactosidase